MLKLAVRVLLNVLGPARDVRALVGLSCWLGSHICVLNGGRVVEVFRGHLAVALRARLLGLIRRILSQRGIRSLLKKHILSVMFNNADHLYLVLEVLAIHWRMHNGERWLILVGLRGILTLE